MTRILLIETSTTLCSVALAEDGRIVAARESAEPRVHAAMTAPYVKEVLGDLSVRDLDAVCVGKGPGSYTGLRVGVSTAKGLCFGAGIPLLSVGTLDTLVWQARAEGLLPEGCRHVVPMIDARRMEVYSAVFTPDARQLRETQPEIIDASSFADILAEGPVLFIGDGVEKCRAVLTSPNAFFAPCSPKAASMAVPALDAFNEKRFEDVAYFEPFYLKEFVATVSRKKLF
jgi:tRNA threonylcarbamoyladenosine biosynthesis protein TsaB